jgi:methionyl-tRNA synthetase
MEKPSNLPYEDFAKLDVRTGNILSAEAVPKSNKLLKLQIDFGPVIGERTIVAGIGADSKYQPDMIVGYGVVAVLNLAPRTFAKFNVTSYGMILAMSHPDGSLWCLSGFPCPPGTEVG